MLTDQEKKRSGSASTGTYVVLFLSLGAMTFFGVCSPQGQQGELAGSAASVAGEEITNAEFARAYERVSDMERRKAGDNFSPATSRVAGQTMDLLIQKRVLFNKAAELGLAATDDEVVRYLAGIEEFKDEKGQFSEERFRNILRSNRYSEASFQEELRRDLTQEKLRQFISSATYVSTKAVELDYRLRETKLEVEYLQFDPKQTDLAISQEEIDAFLAKNENQDKVKAWYESHRSDYSQPEKVHAQHILVSFNGARNAAGEAANRSKDDARKKASDILAAVQKPGADFTAIAKKETDEPSGKTSGGELGYFTRESMVKEFSDVAFTLNAGQVSELVESPFGFHIIKVLDKKPAVETTLDEAKPLIAKVMLQQEKAPTIVAERANEVLNALKTNAPVEPLLANYKVSWQKPNPLPLANPSLPGHGEKQEVTDAILALSKDKPLSEKPIKAGASYLVLRLRDVKAADVSKLTPEDRKQQASIAAYMQGYSFYDTFVTEAMQEFEARKSIYRNPAYLALDQRQENT